MTPTTREKIRAALAQIIATVDHPHWGQYPLQGHPAIDIGREALALLDQEESAPPTPDVEAGRASLRMPVEGYARWWIGKVRAHVHADVPLPKTSPDGETLVDVLEALLLRSSAPPEEGQPEGMETAAKNIAAKLRNWHEARIAQTKYPEDKQASTLAEQAADVIDRLLAERNTVIAIWKGKRIRELEADLAAASASSEADRAELTRCLDTQRKIEAENAKLRNALEPFATVRFGENIPLVWRDRARAALAAENGGDA